MNLFTVANCSIQYIYISIIQHQYNWACSTGHNIKSIHKLSVKKINTLFFNQTLVTQNELSVADASRTPRGCGFDVLECQKGWQLVIKVNWKFLRFSIAIGHFFTEVTNQLALFLESHQFLLVFLANIFAALGVVGWNKKTKCCEFALAVRGLQKSVESTVWNRGLRSKCQPDITAASTPLFQQERGNSFSPPPPPPAPPVFWSGINFREQRIFLRLMCGNTGYFCGLLENKKKQRNLSRIYVFSLGAPNYNLYSIHIILTFKMIGDVKQSRLLGVNKRILGFKTADRGQRFRESSGHTLLHVTQHGESTYK